MEKFQETTAQNLPVVYSMLDKNLNDLIKLWLKEMEKNSKIKNSGKVKEQAENFLQTVLSVLKDGVFREVTSDEINALKRILKALQSSTEFLGEDISETTNYLMTLKTAFLKFLQHLGDEDCREDLSCAHNEVKSFASLLDMLAYLLVSKESSTNREKINLLQSEIFHDFLKQKIIAQSDMMKDVFEKVEIVAGSDISVLIQGESGVGKELVAEAVHYGGARHQQPFLTVNCAAIPENLLESELFGYEKGSFTGADNTRIGKIEAAQGGTVFLDEIGEMPLEMQAKILRVLQNREITRVGGNYPIKVSARFISATNKNLADLVKQGSFRDDLYYRLAVFPINVPALRERKEDIPLLAEYFLEKELEFVKKSIKSFTPESLKVLMHYDYPGNIRELENVIKRAVLLAKEEVIRPEDIMFFERTDKLLADRSSSTAVVDDLRTLEEIEKDIIRQRVDSFDGNISKAAKSLGVTRATIYKKLES